MSDCVIDDGAGGELPGEDGPLDELSHTSAASLRTLVEAAVLHRSVDEVADLVAVLRATGRFPDAADQALQAAAVSRPIEEVIALAVLLAEEEAEPHTGVLPGLHPDPASQPYPAPDLEPDPERQAHVHAPAHAHPHPHPHSEPHPTAAAPALHELPDRQPREAAPHEGSAAGRALRWPLAATLPVSAVLYLPRDPSRFPALAGPLAWCVLALAGGCLTLAVLVTTRDRGWVWSAAAVTGIGLVSTHALAAVTDRNVFAGTAGGLLPWPTGVAMLAGGLTAVLSVMVLLYRSERRQQPAPAQPAPSARR